MTRCLRLGPMVVDFDEQDRGVHGTDERVTKRAYLQGIRMLVKIIEGACLSVRPENSGILLRYALVFA